LNNSNNEHFTIRIFNINKRTKVECLLCQWEKCYLPAVWSRNVCIRIYYFYNSSAKYFLKLYLSKQWASLCVCLFREINIGAIRWQLSRDWLIAPHRKRITLYVVQGAFLFGLGDGSLTIYKFYVSPAAAVAAGSFFSSRNTLFSLQPCRNIHSLVCVCARADTKDNNSTSSTLIEFQIFTSILLFSCASLCFQINFLLLSFWCGELWENFFFSASFSSAFFLFAPK